MKEKRLSAIIEKLRCELDALIKDKENFCDPEIIRKSKQLDRAHNLLMKLYGYNNKRK